MNLGGKTQLRKSATNRSMMIATVITLHWHQRPDKDAGLAEQLQQRKRGRRRILRNGRSTIGWIRFAGAATEMVARSNISNAAAATIFISTNVSNRRFIS